MHWLEERKQITSWQGKGAVVRGREWPYPITSRTRIHQSLEKAGAELEIRVVRTLKKKRPPIEIAELLNISLRERVPFIEFLISAEKLPIAIGHHFVSPAVNPELLTKVEELVEIAASYAAIGVEDYVRRHTVVRTRMATEYEAGLLQIPRQQPLFVLRGLNVDLAEKPLEVTEAIVRGDRMRVEI